MPKTDEPVRQGRQRRSGVPSWVHAKLAVWANWHIRRLGHEDGWSSASVVLNEWGTLTLGHRVLIKDRPTPVREVDAAIGHLHHLLAKVLILEYVWDRGEDGRTISRADKARALEVSSGDFQGLLKVARKCLMGALNDLDLT